MVPVTVAGVLIGATEAVLALSFASLIFAGSLAGHVATGTGLMLATGMIMLAVTSLFSSAPGATGSIQDATSAILALAAARIAAEPGLAPDAAFSTVIALIVLASLGLGLLLFAFGSLRLGNLVRFIPHPVVGGFLAGTGWLLARGGFEVMAGTVSGISDVTALLRPGALLLWIPGSVLAVALLITLRRLSHAFLLPGLLGVAIATFFVALLLTGTGIGDAQRMGLLLGPFASAGLWQPVALPALADAHWSLMWGSAGDLAALWIVAVLGLLLNSTAVEFVIGRDLELNRELRVAGLANAAAGLAGGAPGYHALSLTSLGHHVGGLSRLVGVVAAGVCGIVLVAGASIVELVPRPILGGLLLFLGLDLLRTWVVDARRRLPASDYLVILVIAGVVAVFGFLPGLLVGLGVTIAGFTVRYSRIDPVKYETDGSIARSAVERPPPDREALDTAGRQIWILELHGFLFFGTAHSLVERVRSRARSDEPLRFLVLDFRRVSRLDSSAVQCFAKLVREAEDRRFGLLLTHLRDDVRALLAREGVHEGEGRPVYVFGDLDHGLEWCEDQLLGGDSLVPADGSDWVLALFDVAGLRRYFERLDVQPGQVLVREGDLVDGIYVVESGRLSAQVVSRDGQVMRLRTLGPGTVFGEAAMYLGERRTASVVAERPGVVYRLSVEMLAELQEREPRLAVALHRRMAQFLAERLVASTRMVAALRD